MLCNTVLITKNLGKFGSAHELQVNADVITCLFVRMCLKVDNLLMHALMWSNRFLGSQFFKYTTLCLTYAVCDSTDTDDQ